MNLLVTPVRYLKRAADLPIHTALFRAGRFFWRKLGDVSGAVWDSRRPTYLSAASVPQGSLARLLPEASLVAHEGAEPALTETCRHYVAHRFDLLGSGWIEVTHGTACRGLAGSRLPPGEAVRADPDGRWLKDRVNRANRADASSIWRLIFAEPGIASPGSGGYTPIDWHLDFVSGYRWRERTWYRNVQYAHREGVDVKVPWELARMQHLPQCALAFALSEGQGESPDAAAVADGESPTPPVRFIAEIRHQILDFIATNPPRYGVNWRCTMDVAIRVSNWLFAVDLARAAGAEFDAPFLTTLKTSVFQHGRHIYDNLERPEGGTGNHYLANVVGLLFVSSFLPKSPEVDRWLEFSRRELVSEVERQFLPDGGHFEGSTAYHRLSAEMVAWGTALALRAAQAGAPPGRRPEWEFPNWYIDRIRRMRDLLADATRPDGMLVLIGDNDSGSFIKALPRFRRWSPGEVQSRYLNMGEYAEGAWSAAYWREETTDSGLAVSLLDALLKPEPGERVESALLGGLVGEEGAPWHAATDVEPRKSAVVRPVEPEAPIESEGSFAFEFRVPGADLWEGLTTTAYPSFGLIVYRSTRSYLAIRCGPMSALARSAHGHDDQMSMEFWVDGAALVVDPGVFVYTPLPESHRWFRSSWVHGLPSKLDADTDAHPGKRLQFDGGRVLRCDATGLLGEVVGPLGSRSRRFTMFGGGLRISDTVPFRSAATQFTLGPGCVGTAEGTAAIVKMASGAMFEFVADCGECSLGETVFAPSYGWLQRTSVLQWCSFPEVERRWPARGWRLP